MNHLNQAQARLNLSAVSLPIRCALAAGALAATLAVGLFIEALAQRDQTSNASLAGPPLTTAKKRV